MDIRRLEAFVAVLKNGSVTQAAALLGVTQPAVSAQLLRLEEEVGFALFERTGNRVRPTAEALAFHAEVERTLSVLGDLGRTAESIRNGSFGSLVIVCHPSAGISLLPPAIAAFGRQRPGVRVQLFTRHSDAVRGLFPSRTFDIGIAELPIDPSGLAVTRHQMQCVAVLPEKHPLSAHDLITPELMHGEPFITVLPQRASYHQIRTAFAERGAYWNVVVEAEMFASVCGLVANGLGVSIVDPASAEEFAPLGVAVRRFAPAIPYDIAVFHSDICPPSLVTQAFLDVLAKRIEQLTSTK
jgi:DNA-binding transcriptional LysR family regulator